MARRVPIEQRGPGQSYRPDLAPPSIFGAHQPGIATPLLDHLVFAAFDVADRDPRDLLAEWSARAERLMRAHDALTLTIGLGPGIFDERFGLRHARPLALEELPAFPGDELDRAWCGGDLCVQACADDPRRAAGAVDELTGAVLRWRQDGFLPRGPHDKPSGRPRDLLGFKSGTSNPRRGRDLDRHVWVGPGERTWMRGGTLLVVRRIEIALDAWRALAVAEQERVIGRHRDSGAPIGAAHEFDPLPMHALAPDAHVRLAARETNAGVTMLRRSYSYERGLLFLGYQRDPRRQFVALQRRLAEHDALSAYTTHVGSAVFALPPGARPGGFVGDGLCSGPRQSSD
jgi:deferrochelatase/peroxidase EfeB